MSWKRSVLGLLLGAAGYLAQAQARTGETLRSAANTTSTSTGCKLYLYLMKMLPQGIFLSSDPDNCPAGSAARPARSLYCPESVCAAVVLTSPGTGSQLQPDSLGCFTYEGSLLGDEYPIYINKVVFTISR